MNRKHPLTVAFRKLLNNRLATICFIVLVIELILVLFAPQIAKCDPNETDILLRLPNSSASTGLGQMNLAVISGRVCSMAEECL